MFACPLTYLRVLATYFEGATTQVPLARLRFAHSPSIRLWARRVWPRNSDQNKCCDRECRACA